MSTGGLYFAIHLSEALQRISFLHEFDTVTVKRYGKERTGQNAKIVRAPITDLRGRTVIVIEDIIDVGDTVRCLQEYFKKEGAATIQYCTLLLRKNQAPLEFNIQYIGEKLAMVGLLAAVWTKNFYTEGWAVCILNVILPSNSIKV